MKPHRILLVEDDATSRAFMAAALGGAHCHVDTAETAQAACAISAAGLHALWLIDAHLPDDSGIGLLARLRARDATAPAVAHTASRDPALDSALRAAGFADVVLKPVTAGALVQRVNAALHRNSASSTPTLGRVGEAGHMPVWDDAAALRALNGQQTHVAALRDLFLRELPGAATRIEAAMRANGFEQARGELHRLQASCGFVGAAQLTHAVTRLHADTRTAAWLEFDEAVQRTLACAPPDAPPA